MKKRMQKHGFTALLLALCFLLPGCGREAESVPAMGEETELDQQELRFVALTFDDGPRRGTTDVLLQGLRERGVQATFFIIGEQIQGNQDILQQMQADGHQIGNHTYSHKHLTECSDPVFLEQINKTETLLTDTLGPGDYWLRPPYGLITERQTTLVSTPLIRWSVDPEDWKLLNARKVTAAVLRKVKDGDIILLHDFYASSVQAALQIVDQLQEQGYRFVTVRALLQRRGECCEAGVIYRRAP